MNVFRRFEVPAERMYEFYGGVLGFKQLSTLNVGNGGGVARFQAGAQELKLTRRVGDRSYERGGVRGATGLRLLTFFFADEAALSARFVQHGLPAPEFTDLRPSAGGRALVTDPDGQQVELVIVPGATRGAARPHRGRAHGRRPRAQPRVLSQLRRARRATARATTSGSARASTPIGTVRRRSACAASVRVCPPTPAAAAFSTWCPTSSSSMRWPSNGRCTIDQPLQGLRGFDLRTIWLDDPDGVTNYFAETGASRRARAHGRDR